MLPFRRILFPVDYTPSCRAVVPYVQDMASHFHAQLAVMHAFALQPCLAIPNPREALVYTDLGGELPQPVEQARAQETQRLRDFASVSFPVSMWKSSAKREKQRQRSIALSSAKAPIW